MSTLSKNKIVLGLSGGVDSTTAALLLKKQGFEIIGYFFDVMGNNEEGAKAAKDLADRMEIPLIIENVSTEFEEKIIGNFCSEYCSGRTPNPCVICNPMIKFRRLLETADREGAYYIATGHYARISYDEEKGLYYIRKGASERKDQSYMLYRLGQDVLSRLILPLGDFEDKEATRDLARTYSMPNAEASDSQEICFIDDKIEDYTSFMKRKGFSCPEGNFVDRDGKVLGSHQGINRYTVGQRKGLGIALGKPVFVTKIDAEHNQVVLGDHEDLFRREVVSVDNFFTETSSAVMPESLAEREGLSAKIRYAAKPASVKLMLSENGQVTSVFEEPQRAVTAGQSIVFYDDDLVVGGGFIK